MKSLCPRCNGSGHLPQYQHVQRGICFLCWGKGSTSSPDTTNLEVYLVGAILKGNGQFAFPIMKLQATSQESAYQKAKGLLLTSKTYDVNSLTITARGE